MSLSFNTTNLPEPTEEEMKILMVQQLQLMVALRQKEIEEDESRKRAERGVGREQVRAAEV